MTQRKDPAPTWAAHGGGAGVSIEGTSIGYDWMGKGYQPSVRFGGPDFKLGSGDTRDVGAAKGAAVSFAREILEAERARIDRVLAALDTIRDEQPQKPRPASRRGRGRR